MKQNISAMMDGELCDDEAEILLGKIRRDSAGRQEWASYHLIGDALRQPDYLRINLSSEFFERLQAEPIVFAPQRQRSNKTSIFAVSAVASVMAVVMLAWLSLEVDNGERYKAPGAQPGLQAATLPSGGGVHDYLLAHHEFSPGSDVRGASSYLRTVADKQIVAVK